MRSVSIQCFGRVQGVFYRASTKDMADKLSICGWVKNMKDGSVLIEASGNAGSIDQLIEWCHQGPQIASVTKVIVNDKESVPGQGKGFSTLR